MTRLPSSTPTLSAKGTRLNRRGLETREHVLRVALRCLASGDPDAVSANLVAREAGVTWGTVQHQFGDVDGLWAAVLGYVADHRGPGLTTLPDVGDLETRVRGVLEVMWQSLELPGQLALYHLRLSLPRNREDLEEQFPQTAKAIAYWDAEWTAMCEQAFADLQVDPEKVAKVRHLLPGAIRGLHNEQHLSSYTDANAGREGLAEALTAYLGAS
ncbi:TetR/AcrR family transcriptional regulator [Nocardioides daejeonensis]|uniref:TetR/AcrR family transcriptional regulator n=1 Tax=Nocardioides daejeonensis TaxID=1046556 RepID=UPI000D74E7A9|nr:TetR/AcrR family transcriptional regulator [Nocardioides daejeonensis]